MGLANVPANLPGDERISVIGTAERGGKGRGVRQGVRIARGQIIGFVDADYKTPIEEIEKILPWFAQGFDIVIGSRGVGESKIERKQKLYRRIGSKVFALGMRRSLACGRSSTRNAGSNSSPARRLAIFSADSPSMDTCSMWKSFVWRRHSDTR